jgi:hypothetical protein
MGVPLQGSTVENLWAQARELSERALAEADHPALRRALVVAAVAGSGSDPEAYRALVESIARASARLAFADPQPLFDAAAALVDHDDLTAREAIVLAPTRI